MIPIITQVVSQESGEIENLSCLNTQFDYFFEAERVLKKLI